MIKAPLWAAGTFAFLPADLFDRRRWSEPVSGFERQRSSVGVRIESRFRGGDAPGRNGRKLRAQPHRWARLEEPCECPRTAVLGVVFGEAMVAIDVPKGVIAGGDTISSYRLPSQRIPRGEAQIDTSLRREAHPR